MNKIKVHPNVAAASLAVSAAEEKGEAVSLTVWRRSLLFNGKGFTKLSLAEEWLVYDGDGDEPAPRRFTARRNRSLLRTKSLARLSPPRSLDGTGDAPGCRYDVEGSYAGRSLDMFACPSWASGGNQRRRVATVCRKEAAVGLDVFRLIVEPDFEPALAMAMVILLDQMNAS
uniref:Protein LURP-one-related 8 n=1 Tax=Aegilops tauschii TaxID=37682 RepID=R7WFP0_AEGTA